MYLLYRNQGERRFGINPSVPHPRKSWAFQVNFEGDCSLLVRENNTTREHRLSGPVLSIAGPSCVHAWGGRSTDICKILAFHFDEADPILCSVIGQKGYRYVRISPASLLAIQALYERCNEVRRAPGFISPSVHVSYGKLLVNPSSEDVPRIASLDIGKKAAIFAPLVYGIVARELTLLFLKHLPRHELGSAPDFGENKVAEALAWYGVNMVTNPNIQEVAKAIHVSATHLRRLFQKVRGMSPQTALTRVQFERAKWLMRDFAMSLEQVAENSGFGSASAFSRSFKKEFGISPKTYREKLQKK